MVRSASCASRTMRPRFIFSHPSRRALKRAPQGEDPFLYALFLDFFAAFLLSSTSLLVAGFFAATFAVLRAFGRFFTAARWAAAKAALAQPLNSSGSSKSRAGNCQYELTVTVLARVWY